MGIINMIFRNILLDEKICKNILIYGISCRSTFMGSIPFGIRFDEIDGFIKIYDGIRYLVLFSYLYDEICNRIKYLTSEKSGIADSIDSYFAKIRIDLYSYLPIEEICYNVVIHNVIHNVITLIKLVINENKNKCYFNIFLQKKFA